MRARGKHERDARSPDPGKSLPEVEAVPAPTGRKDEAPTGECPTCGGDAQWEGGCDNCGNWFGTCYGEIVKHEGVSWTEDGLTHDGEVCPVCA